MSRGPGRVQRYVLERVAGFDHGPEDARAWEGALPARDIARELASDEPTEAQLESVRRAIRRLEANGRVATSYVDGAVVVRPPLTDRERAALAEKERQQRERRDADRAKSQRVEREYKLWSAVADAVYGVGWYPDRFDWPSLREAAAVILREAGYTVTPPDQH